ncbi:hypothetical protein ACHAW6_005556 [Cyclotella cf. meneghiniana]
MVTTRTKHVLQCGGLRQAWHQWKRLPAIQHTLLTVKPIGQPPSISNETLRTLQLENSQSRTMQLRVIGGGKQTTHQHCHKLQEDKAKLLSVILHMAVSYQHTSPPQEPTSGWDPKGYCHTHGYKVHLGHNSKTCRYKNHEHHYNANHQNMTGDSQKKLFWWYKG